MRNKLIKEIRRTARALFPDVPYVEYEEKPARLAPRNTIRMIEGIPVKYEPKIRHLSGNCIKKLMQDTKRHIRNG